MKYEAVVFDLDGTLLDSIDDIRDSVNRSMRRLRLPEITREQAYQRVGNGSARLLELCLPGGRSFPGFDGVVADYTAWYADHCLVSTRPFIGLTEVLEALVSRGVRCAVVSNKPEDAADRICRRFFPGLLECTVGAGDGAPLKPAPDTTLAALARLGVPPERACYVGDTQVDVMTAKNAGMDMVAVLWGFRSRAQLLDAGAVVLADTPERLLGALAD